MVGLVVGRLCELLVEVGRVSLWGIVYVWYLVVIVVLYR